MTNKLFFQQNRQIPADVVLLQSSEENGVCYVETMNLDGETNLKLRIVPREAQSLSWDLFQDVEVNYEGPNRYLYHFQGQMKLEEKFHIALKGINVLLKGSSLKNTEFVYGLVIYTGHESKIMMNSAEPSPKLSSLEKMMNKLIIILFSLQLILCFFTSALNYILMKNMEVSGELNYMKKGDDFIGENSITSVLISMGTWMLIFTNFIPISLLVTLEIVKFYQGYNLMNEEGVGNISVQSSSLNEELGQINHVFSDKTGTLTLNRMVFKNICIDGVNYGYSNEYRRDSVISTDSEQLRKKEEFVDFEDNTFFQLIEKKSQRALKAIQCIYLCHNVVVEKDHQNNPMLSDDVHYSASSPDELALISFAKLCGYVYKGNKKENGREYYIIKHQNSIQEYEVLQLFDFNSYRKRLSVIIRSPDGKIELFCKGADSIIESLLSEQELHNNNLHASKQVTDYYANQGLRTLFLAKKTIPEKEYFQWRDKYNEAERELVDRDVKVEQLKEEMEKNLEFLGVTAVEDKLQDEVGSTIQQIRETGIKFWVLTGDKKQTAITISHSAQIIESDTQLLDLDFKTLEQITYQINSYLQYIKENNQLKYSLIISGDSFHQVENNHDVSKQFVELSLLAQSVIGCRFSPSQKKHAVSLVKKYTKKKPTLAIGDGANDVNMILEAHVGIGVKGVEGSQASRASDFSVNEFKQLKELLFDYGRECYRKNSELVLFNFYKNLILVLPQWWFGIFYSLMSGTTLYDPWIYQMFNTFFTSLPIVVYALIDRQYSKRELLQNYNFYKQGIKCELFNTNKFIQTFLNGLFQALIIMLFTFLCLENVILEENGQVSNFAVTGMVVFSIITLYTNLKIITFSNTFTVFSIFGIIVSYTLYIILSYIMTESNFAKNSPLWKTFRIIFGNSHIIYVMIVTCSFLFLLDTAYQRFISFTYESYIYTYSRIQNRLKSDCTDTSQIKEIKVELNSDGFVKNNNYYKFSDSTDCSSL